jgi:hypothetical protein
MRFPEVPAIENCQADMREYVSLLKSAKGDLMRNSIESQIGDCEKRYKALIEEREKLEKEITQSAITDDEIRDINQFQNDVNDGLQNPTRENIRHMLEVLRAEVWVKENEGKLVLRFPRIANRFEIGTSPPPSPPYNHTPPR